MQIGTEGSSAAEAPDTPEPRHTAPTPIGDRVDLGGGDSTAKKLFQSEASEEGRFSEITKAQNAADEALEAAKADAATAKADVEAMKVEAESAHAALGAMTAEAASARAEVETIMVEVATARAEVERMKIEVRFYIAG